MKYTLAITTCILFAVFACKPESSKTMTTEFTIPDCLQQKIADHIANYPEPFETPANIVKYQYNGQEVYRFDPDPSHSTIRDWVYKAVDSDCKEVCDFGGGFANLPSTCPNFDETAVRLEVVWTHQ